MALLVKKVVVTEVAVTTVKVEVTKANVLDAAGESIQCANAVTWLPDHLDIDIETGVIRNWSAPTSEQLQHSDNADDLLVDALEPSIVAQAAHDAAMDKEAEAVTDLDRPVFVLDFAQKFASTNPATTTPEIQQPVEVAEPVQPEVAETAPEAPQSKTPEIKGIKPIEFDGIKTVENHLINDLPSDAFDHGVALAESVLVSVEPEPVAVEPVAVDDESPRRRTPAQPRYRNPENPEQTWTGRGKQPEWLYQQIATGKNLDDFLIGANPSPVAAQESAQSDDVTISVVIDTPSADQVAVYFDGDTKKWVAEMTEGFDVCQSTSTQGKFEAIKNVLKKANLNGVYEINWAKKVGDTEFYQYDDSRTRDTETVYLSKGADGWIAKTPKNKSVTAAISITGELTALLEPIDNIDDHANAVIVETTDDEIRSRGKRRYSITAGQTVDVAAPAHAPSVPAPEEQPATYAEIVQLINFASEVAHLDNIKAMRIDHHADEKERHALVMKLGSKRAEIMAANAMRIK